MKLGGHNFHPSRVKGSVKFARALEVNRQAEKDKKKSNLKPLDLSKSDWTIDR